MGILDPLPFSPDNTLNDRNRALRIFHQALAKADTTAFDILWGPSDSLGESAYVTAAKYRVTQKVVQKLRRSYGPDGVTGGYGYYGASSNVWVAGDPVFGSTGTIGVGNTYGLGRKHAIMNPASTYIWKKTGTSVDVMFVTGPTGGTYSIDWGDGTAVTTGTTNAGSLGHVKVNHAYTSSGNSFITVTNTDATLNVYMEGLFQYDGDETAGIRMWEAAHAGYAADNYVTSTLWVDSLSYMPNCKLVVLPIGSNDFYAGTTSAATKTKINTIITSLRSKLPAATPIVLVGYYDRPAPAKVEEWNKFVAMYKSIAAADPYITFLDMVPVFGPKVSDTDDRDGLMYPADHVHLTDAAAEIFASAVFDFIKPNGGETRPGAAGVFTTAQSALVDGAASGKQTYTLGANFAGGAASFSGIGLQNYATVVTGNATLAPSGMPAVTAGKTARWFWQFIQDATGGRTLTLDPAIKTVGTFGLTTTANAINLLEFYWDGARWWAFNRSNPEPSTAQTTAINATIGDIQNVYSAAFPAGAITLSGFNQNAYGAFRLVLGGNVTFSAAARPVTAAGKTHTFKLILVQDATGGRTLTLNANVLTAAGVDPVLSTAANAIDVLEFLWTGTELIMTNFVKGVA